jgi:ankyrin repeat protein
MNRKLLLGLGLVLILGIVAGLFAYPEFSRRWAQNKLDEREPLPPELAAVDDPEWSRRLRQAFFIDTLCGKGTGNARLFLEVGYSATEASMQDAITPLHCAALRGDVALASELIALRASVAAVTRSDQLEPIHFAALVRDFEMMRLLLSHGASIEAPSRAGPPLILALTTETRRWLPRSARKAALVAPASRPTNVETLRFFTDLAADVRARNESGETLLHLAAAQGDPALFNAVLELGLDVDARDARGRTPLQYSSMLLDSYTGAAQTGILKALLDHGADVNARAQDGTTAFCYVLDNPRALEVLLARGLDPNVARADGNSCWFGLRRDHVPSEIIEIAALIPALDTPRRPDGSLGAGPLYTFGFENELELVNYFLSRGLKPIDRGPMNYGALHATLRNTGGANDHEASRRAIVKALLDAGAPINQLAADGQTPLMVATLQPPAMIQLLIDRGADVNAINYKTGKSVLDVFERRGRPGTVELLRAAGARPGTGVPED